MKLLKHLPWREAARPRSPPASAPSLAAHRSLRAGQPPTHVVYARHRLSRGWRRACSIGKTPLDGRRVIVIGDQRERRVELALRNRRARRRAQAARSQPARHVREREKGSGENDSAPADVIRIGSPGAELTVVMVEQAREAARNREFQVFSLSFLDAITCGFGAVILLFMLINSNVHVKRDRPRRPPSEAHRRELKVLTGHKNLVQIKERS